ncbi:MAG: nucleotidyltransferase domain-containing protein [Thermodesulfobacteriota bacterium]|nr:nucleotidyltransferase domain-containing protein [Thermodesulfobacteriota bacterium]
MLFGPVDLSLHVREIERRSGLTIGTVRAELQNLLSLDLIQKQKDGNRLYYRANKAHPLYPDIRSLVLKTTGLVDIIQNVLKQDPEIRTAFVFGSIARHEEGAASDVDLMVIGDVGLRKLTGMLTGVPDQIGREINPHILTKEEFVKRKAAGEHFISEVLESPKIFVIGSENELAAMG